MRKTWNEGRKLLGAVAALAVAGAAVACAPGYEETTGAQPAPPGTVYMTDPVIAGIFTTANTGEVDAGRLATSRATNQRVRQFAQRMVTEHGAANDRTMDVLNDIGMSTASSEPMRDLSESARTTVERLRGYEGAAFDRAYMESQVAMHRHVLQTLDNSLIPHARANQLEMLLTSTRPAIAEHLRMAEEILASLPR